MYICFGETILYFIMLSNEIKIYVKYITIKLFLVYCFKK